MKIKSVSVLILTFGVLLLVAVNINKNYISIEHDEKARNERIASVLNTAFDEYDLFSFEMNGTDSIIWIQMDEEDSEEELMEYLEENISKAELTHYKIKIRKRNLQEVQTEDAMLRLESLAIDYIQEKSYDDVQVHYPIFKPEPVLKITINKTSDRSSEELKKELESILASEGSNLPLSLRNISYELQVIKRMNSFR